MNDMALRDVHKSYQKYD